MFKRVTVGALALLLAACTASRPHSAAPQCTDDSPPALQPPAHGSVYRIDEHQSELRVLVYRAGPMARLGHNHVLVNGALCGGAHPTGAPGASVFWLKVPVERFIVDDSRARAEEGSEFEAEVPDDAKAGTREHMLGASMLDAAEFPMIAIRGITGAAAPGPPDAAASIATIDVVIAGHESAVEVPVAVHIEGTRLLATGALDLRQTALGLTPYSLMLGALAVRDSMTVKFKIVADVVGTPP